MSKYKTVEDYDALKSKKAKLALCRDILNNPVYKYYNSPLCSTDKIVMLYVFSNHVNAKHKRLDEVHEIFVQKSAKSKRSVRPGKQNYCFHLQYKDGTADDISFRKCIDKQQESRRDKEYSRFMNILSPDPIIPLKIENLEAAIINRSIPESAGVYFIWENCDLIYIGQSYNLRKRLAFDESHIHTIDPNRKYVNYALCISKERAKELEAKLIKKLAPVISTLKNNCSIAKKSRGYWDQGVDK